MRIEMPYEAEWIIDNIRSHGYEAFIVGGCVRDAVLGRIPGDWDITTSAKPEQVKEIFGKTVDTGLKHGTVTIIKHGSGYEVTTYRIAGEYLDGRHPETVEFTPDLREDLKRRDFTINALAVCLNKGRFGELVDPFGGMNDLKEKIIRTPLDPDITFSDDPLRMMRCIRFATQLNFYIDDDTFESLCRNRERIEIISRERIADELNKIMLSPIPSKGFIDLDRSGLLELIFPELVALQGVETRNGRAHKDNFYHTLEVLDNISRVTDNLWLRWSALLHDIAKPVTKRWEPKA